MIGAGKPCKECPAGTKRPAPHPGPRCTTHWRAFRKRLRTAAHARHVAEQYGITEAQYQAMHAAQGGVCAICQRATGATRALAVDHDHKQAVLDGHEEDHGCPSCIRGLLCRQCNRNVLGHLRDSPEAFERGAAYLRNPPGRSVLSAWASAGSTSAAPGSSADGAPGPASSEPRT